MPSTVTGGHLYIGEDNLVYWGDVDTPGSGLYDAYLGCFVNDATVTFTLKDSSNSTVSGASSVSMSYITGSRGCYAGVLEDGVSLTENATYYLEITATGSGDRIGFRRLAYTAIYHGAS